VGGGSAGFGGGLEAVVSGTEGAGFEGGFEELPSDGVGVGVGFFAVVEVALAAYLDGNFL